MVSIKDQEVNRLRERKQFEFDFQVRFWPADPFGGVWVDEDMIPTDVVSICFSAQELIAADLAKFPIEHRNCVRNLRGRVVACVSSIWWEEYLDLAG